jgi:hypothetical protein
MKMIDVPEFIKLRAGYEFPFYVHTPCVRFKSDRKFTSAMVVVELSDELEADAFTYLGEGFTSRSPRDRNNPEIGHSVAYSRALIDALKQHINYLKEKENK